MKKRRKSRPSLFDRFCSKFGPAILKVCRFIDKQTHDFFEGLAWAITMGAYQPRPYQEPKEIKQEDDLSTITIKRSPRKTLKDDLRAVMGDIHSVSRDISKAVRQIEQEDPNVTQAIQETQHSPEYKKQVQKLQDKMTEVQQRCHHVRHVCSHPHAMNNGSTSGHDSQRQ